MGKATKIAQAGYEAFSMGRSVLGAAKNPIKHARRLAAKAARKALLAGLKAAFGERWAAGAIGKLSMAGRSWKGAIGIQVPEWLAQRAMDPQGATLVQKIANDVLAAPFELIGYKVVATMVSYDEIHRELRLGLEVGVIDMSVVDVEMREVATPAAPPALEHARQRAPKP